MEAECFQSAACYQNRVFPSIDFLAFAAPLHLPQPPRCSFLEAKRPRDAMSAAGQEAESLEQQWMDGGRGRN